MDRRKFIQLGGVGFGTLLLPPFGFAVSESRLSEQILDQKAKKHLADVALNTARKLGASYCDIRIGRYLQQFIRTRDENVQGVTNTESFGIGVRVIAKDTWGFAATDQLTADGVMQATQTAIAIAKANSQFQQAPVRLAPSKGVGEVSWQTPIEINPLDVAVKDKAAMLLDVNQAALKQGAAFVNSTLFIVNEQKYFASTDGSYIDQNVFRIWPPFTVTAVDKKTGKFRSRAGFGTPVGMGYEYLRPDEKEKTKVGSMVFYGRAYDMKEDAILAAEQAREKLTAPSVKPGKYDLVLEPNHLGLTIHESIGHPTELDRVLGYEANYAGTSFVDLEKVKQKIQYGSEIVNVFADKTQETSLGAVGFDDEGVKTKRWDIIKDGKLVNLQAIRDQAHMLGEKSSHGCCYADSWSSVQFQRMPNISLSPGKEAYSAMDMIKDVDNGIFIAGRGSYSIDQQRYNFQFGGTMFYEIKKGKITRMIEDVAYQANTLEFWNSAVKICDASDYRFMGTFFDGKGQPSQVSAVSHGSSTTRFNGVTVINTARKIG